MNKGLKKGFSVAMATAMAMSMMVMPVSAETGNNSMSVDYSTGGTTYTLSIPASITLSDSESKQTTEVGVSAVNTIPTQKVQVKIKSGITDGKVELTRKKNETEFDTAKVVSTVTGKDGASVADGFVVAEFQDMDTTPLSTSNGGELNFSKISDSQGGTTVKAGTYVGTIVFEGGLADR